MKTKITSVLFLSICFVLFAFTTKAQNGIEYGADYIVFEAEATSSSLAKWTIRKPGDPEYLKYETAGSLAPINDTYLDYAGAFGGEAGTDLDYTFTCPKSGTYTLAIRMHSPLRNDEKADKRNDVFIKMSGDFTSAGKNTTADLKKNHKLFGRGPNKWGSCHMLEHNGLNQVFYNLTAGKEYTFTISGRSPTTGLDYVVIYQPVGDADVALTWKDLAIQLPETYRPGKVQVTQPEVSFNNAPTSVITTTSFNVDVDYVATAAQQLVVIINSPTGAWLGNGKLNVAAGTGTATVTVNMATAPPVANGYKLRCDIRPVGGDGNSALDTKTTTVNIVAEPVTNEAFYIVNRQTGKKLRCADAIDGSVLQQVPASSTGDLAKWTKVDTGDGYFHLVNVSTGFYFRPDTDLDGSNIIQRPSSYNGDWTRWAQVATTGDYFYLQNKATSLYFRPSTDEDNSAIIQRPTTYSGNYTQWMFVDVATGVAKKSEIATSTSLDLVQLSVYPNPTTSTLNVTTQLEGDFTVTVCDTNGKQLIGKSLNSASISSLDVSALMNGVYLVVVQNQEYRETVRFVKN